MRVLSLVYRHEFEFPAQTVNNALVFGDLDNDGYDEFAIGNHNGEVLIFKGREIWQKFTKLGWVTCLAIGDILNEGRNCLVVVTGDGFCHIYDRAIDPESSAIEASEEINAGGAKEGHVVHVHTQRVPANVKDILLGDIDGDGRIEMVLGLTDRVVRSYRWFSGNPPRPGTRRRKSDKPRLIALNKWECAKQIGSITLHHNKEGKPCILVAQPGGTFMRIRCHADGSPSSKDNTNTTRGSSPNENAQHSTVDYQMLGLSRMRSQDIATEIVGDFRTGDPIYPPGTFRSNRPVLNPDDVPRRVPPESPPPSPPSSPRSSGSPGSSTTSDDTTQTQIDATKLSKELESASLTTVSPSSSVEVGADAVEEVDSTSQGNAVEPGKLPRSNKSAEVGGLPEPSTSAGSSSSAEPDISGRPSTSAEPGASDGPSTSAEPSIPAEPSTSAQASTSAEPSTSAIPSTRTICSKCGGVKQVAGDVPPNPNEGRPEPQQSRAYAVATLDGTIMLVQDEVILWAFQVDRQIFGLHKLDLNDDQLDEIVCCAWDGQVYMLDQHKTVVKFNLEEPVKAFACGMFSGEKDRSPKPAFAFVTFNQRLYIYYNIRIEHMALLRYDPDITAMYPVFMKMENLTKEQAIERIRNMSQKEKAKVISTLLYNFK